MGPLFALYCPDSKSIWLTACTTTDSKASMEERSPVVVFDEKLFHVML